MLFDLSGKRKKVVQIVYSILAVLFAISFIGFGVGSDAAGGIFDALGIGGGGSSGPAQYGEQIERAEQRLAENPRDRRALLELARYEYLAGQQDVGVDEETGAPVLEGESRQRYEDAVAAWSRYMRTDPRRPDTGVASLMVNAFAALQDFEGAAEAQRVVASSNPSQGTYGTLAYYLYSAGEIAEGDEAVEQAVQAAPQSARKGLRGEFAQIRKEAVRFEKQRRKAAEQGGAEELENPFGGLGGLGGASPTP